MTAAYKALADYAVVGDTRSCALISRDGSIDWLCWPRFDSRSQFAAILDADKGGCFSIQPSIPFRATRRYLDDTNVLETTFTTERGVATLIDLMPVMRESDKHTLLTPFRQLLRRVEVIEGEVPLVVRFEPRPNYARAAPPLTVKHNALFCVDRATVLHLHSDITFDVQGCNARGERTLRSGERADFALAFDDHTPAVYPMIGDGATAAIDRTLRFWRDWSSQLAYGGEYRDAVMRSALVLKLLTYAPSGAIVAAPTTSLPEVLGGIRNWDYRYAWLRDAAFTSSALYDCGFHLEGDAFAGWLMYATRLTHPKLQMLYDVAGESQVPEQELDHLSGYANSKPVRIGNAAHDQFQLDVYGEVLGTIEEYVRRGKKLNRDVRTLVHRLADMVAKRWREPDAGIWEKRSGREQHVHSKVMAWSALDCAERLTKSQRWRAEKDAIRELVLSRGFNAERQSFVSVLDGKELDASLLYIVRVGLLEPDDPRMLSTIDAIRRELGNDDLVYRYDTRATEDGLPPGEGAFLPCSFWLAEALSLAGREAEARELFEKLLARRNEVGLLPEEIDPQSGAFLGNMPQALTHIGLLNAAICMSEQMSARSQRNK
jgi:GH15 family glucan-1,4-alpha-glucosidase